MRWPSGDGPEQANVCVQRLSEVKEKQLSPERGAAAQANVGWMFLRCPQAEPSACINSFNSLLHEDTWCLGRYRTSVCETP